MYIANTDDDRQAMLQALGLGSIDELFRDIPGEIRLNRPLDLPAAMSEPELLSHLNELAGLNGASDRWTCFLGGGAYDHHVPAVVGYILSRGEFLTSYTPYQAEISQGTLQAIYEFQTMICALTAMDAANASLYDGASAVGEAALMACRVTGRERLAVARSVNPMYRQVLATYVSGHGCKVDEVPFVIPWRGGGSCAQDAQGRHGAGTLDIDALQAVVGRETAAVIVQEPNFFGLLEPMREVSNLAREAGALLIVVCNPISLGLLEPPGAYGADVAVGEGQPLGCPLSYGGPYFGFFAARRDYLRQLPGRVVGATVDSQGRRGYVLTLQAREQHIRRQKATSNICSNQALMALAAAVYLSLMGPQGIRRVAELCAAKARFAANGIGSLPGCELVFPGPFFHEFVIRPNRPVPDVLQGLLAERVLGGLDLGRFYEELGGCMLVAVTEKRTRHEIERLIGLLARLTSEG